MQTIEITTTQNVTIEYELASMRERILAWLLDLFVVAFGYLLIFQLVRLIFGRRGLVRREVLFCELMELRKSFPNFFINDSHSCAKVQLL